MSLHTTASSLVNIDVLTSGATYTSSSGTVYSTSSTVPVPAIMYLFGFGLMGLAGIRSRLCRNSSNKIKQ